MRSISHQNPTKCPYHLWSIGGDTFQLTWASEPRSGMRWTAACQRASGDICTPLLAAWLDELLSVSENDTPSQPPNSNNTDAVTDGPRANATTSNGRQEKHTLWVCKAGGVCLYACVCLGRRAHQTRLSLPRSQSAVLPAAGWGSGIRPIRWR